LGIPISDPIDCRNGDVHSYTDFYYAIDKSGVDTSMVARSALVKPWIFEEIEKHQHLDKSATERLEMLKQFAHWGLEHWVSPLDSVDSRVLTVLEFPPRAASFANS
jgi:tRNA-dihydrouridine synthase 3